MCRQAWFPPGSARDAETLVKYLARLEKSCGGHGNGVGWIEMPDGGYDITKGVKLSVEKAAELLVQRPRNAWGIFHTRFVSAGNRGNSGCHPHVYESPEAHKRLAVLTHNGTWFGWQAACLALAEDYPSDSATICALMSMYGFGKVAAAVDETVIAGIKEKGIWKLRVWEDTCPLVLLKSGGVASEGGDGEFEATAALAKGGHNLLKPRTVQLKSTFYTTPTASMVPGTTFHQPLSLESKVSTTKPGGTWMKCADGAWRQVDTTDTSWVEQTYGDCLLPGVADTCKGGE